jgi:hypothetical protein
LGTAVPDVRIFVRRKSALPLEGVVVVPQSFPSGSPLVVVAGRENPVLPLPQQISPEVEERPVARDPRFDARTLSRGSLLLLRASQAPPF